MKLERKKIVLALLFIASLLILLRLLVSIGKEKQEPEVPGIAVPIDISPSEVVNPPTLPSYYQEVDSPTFRFIITAEQVNLPNKAPLLLRSTRNPISLESARKIATEIGIASEPEIVKDPDLGTAYYWSGSGHSLNIYPFWNQIDYALSSGYQIETGNALTVGQYQSIAGNFLVNKFLINRDLLKFASILYYSSSEYEHIPAATSADQADKVIVNITLNGPNYPIFTTNPDRAIFSITMTRSGKIAQAISNFGYEYIEGSAQAELLSYDEVVKNMDSAVFVRLDEPTMTGFTLKERGATLANGTINSIELVYVLDKPDAAILQPAFLMKGDVVLIDRGQSVTIPAQLYLPALRSLYN